MSKSRAKADNFEKLDNGFIKFVLHLQGQAPVTIYHRGGITAAKRAAAAFLAKDREKWEHFNNQRSKNVNPDN